MLFVGFAIASLIIVVLLLAFSPRLMQFFNLTSLKFKTYEPKEVFPNNIDRKILIRVARYERFLYKAKFTRRLIIEYRSDFKKQDGVFYKFYYYQLIDGIHAYLEVIPSKNGNIYINYCFETVFESGNICLSINKESFILGSKAPNIHLYTHKDLSIRELYKAHCQDREIVFEVVLKKRLTIKEFMEQEVKKEQDYINNLIENGYVKRENAGYKILKTYRLFKEAQKTCEILNIKTYKFKIIVMILLIYLLTGAAIVGGFYYLSIKDSKAGPKIEIQNQKQELAQFENSVLNLQGLTALHKAYETNITQQSMKIIDNYLKNSKIKRFIGEPYKGDINSSSLPCKLPDVLAQMYKWHNGIENIVPNRNFDSYENAVKRYESFKNATDGNFVFAFGNRIKYTGLAYNCAQNGIYNFSVKTPADGYKEFYNFKHFLKVVSQSYKQKAFYDDFDILKIDLKKFLKIYRENFSKIDKLRYKEMIELLKKKAKMYSLTSSLELKKAVIKQIGNTGDPALIGSLKPFLQDKNSDIAANAVDALGDIGDKSALPELLKYLKNKKQHFREKALIAIAKIVNSKDAKILKYIYPMLKDKSIFVRLSAYQVIYAISNPKSLPVLKQLFPNEKNAGKLEIIKIIGKIGTKKDIEFLKNYLKTVEKMDFNKEFNTTVRGSDPHPKILEYEIYRAVARIESRYN